MAYSSAGFFTRLTHLDAWTMLFWRGLFAGLMILCVIATVLGHLAAICSTTATILRHSSVADAAAFFCRRTIPHRW